MKKLILTCAILAAASVASFAQTAAAPQAAQAKPVPANKPMNAEQLAERRTKVAEKQYGLNPDQTKKVHEVEMEFTQAMEKYRTAGQTPGPGQLGNLTVRRDQQMKEILTAEQFAKYEQLNAKRNANQAAQMNAKAPAAPTAPAQSK